MCDTDKNQLDGFTFTLKSRRTAQLLRSKQGLTPADGPRCWISTENVECYRRTDRKPPWKLWSLWLSCTSVGEKKKEGKIATNSRSYYRKAENQNLRGISKYIFKNRLHRKTLPRQLVERKQGGHSKCLSGRNSLALFTTLTLTMANAEKSTATLRDQAQWQRGS